MARQIAATSLSSTAPLRSIAATSAANRSPSGRIARDMTVPSVLCLARHIGLLSPEITEQSSSSTNGDEFMASIQKRIALGFIVAAISVLTFHQAMWELLHYLSLPGLGMPPPFPTEPVPPF